MNLSMFCINVQNFCLLQDRKLLFCTLQRSAKFNLNVKKWKQTHRSWKELHFSSSLFIHFSSSVALGRLDGLLRFLYTILSLFYIFFSLCSLMVLVTRKLPAEFLLLFIFFSNVNNLFPVFFKVVVVVVWL